MADLEVDHQEVGKVEQVEESCMDGTITYIAKLKQTNCKVASRPLYLRGCKGGARAGGGNGGGELQHGMRQT